MTLTTITTEAVACMESKKASVGLAETVFMICPH